MPKGVTRWVGDIKTIGALTATVWCICYQCHVRDTHFRGVFCGFDHGAGHPLLLLYDAKISRGENVNNFNSLDYNPFIVSTSLF